MSRQIRKVAVLGAGIMGSGIAAHIANAGVPVVLLDIVPFKAAPGEDTSSKAFRNKYAAGAIKKFKKTKPSPIFSERVKSLIEVGNFDDDLDRIAECDWVVEVIIERLDIKQGLFAKVEKLVKPGTIVSSNTSGLRIADMLEGRGDDFKKNFCVTHFFNPVRYMKLLELVSGDETDAEVIETLHKFGEETLGKGIVYGKDTTNFVANRIGVYGMMKTLAEMRSAELTVEEVDKIMGTPMGRPKSAIFRTADLVGLDTFAHVSRNCYDSLTDDEQRDIFQLPDFITAMLDKKLLGDKTGSGFYKKSKDESGKRVILSLDLDTLEYTAQKKVRFDSLKAAKKGRTVSQRVSLMIKGDDRAARFAESVTLNTLAYASKRIPEITDDIVNIDRGMRWGFGWDQGPFESWDAIGVQYGLDRMKELGIEPAPWVAEMVASGRETFYSVDGLADIYWDIQDAAPQQVQENARTSKVEYLKRGNKKVEKNAGATIWDMDDGILLLEFHTKMNALEPDIINLLDVAVDLAERDFRGLVIGNDATNFSVGANIMLIMMAAAQKSWDQIEAMIVGLQNTAQKARYSQVPVVTCPAGMTLGGGAEVTMCGNAVQAYAETYIGLVEVGVGLIPGGSGNLQMLRNLYGDVAMDKDFDPFPYVKKVFLSVGMAKVATSAEEGREAGFFNNGDGVSFNRDFLLSDAKAKAIGMAESGFRPPRPTQFLLPGPSGKATIDMLLYDMRVNQQVSAHDQLIGGKLANVLTGGNTSTMTPVSEERLLELEREAFLSLCGEPKTLERIGHMLQTGKPLRN